VVDTVKKIVRFFVKSKQSLRTSLKLEERTLKKLLISINKETVLRFVQIKKLRGATLTFTAVLFLMTGFITEIFADVAVRELDAEGVPPGLADLTGGKWIWRPGLSALETSRLEIPAEVAFFEITLDRADPTVQSVWFSGTADNLLSLFVNGEKIYTSTDWQKLDAVEFHGLLTNKTNVVRIEAKNKGTTVNAGGVIGKILIERTDGSTDQIFTEGWQASADGKQWGAPSVLGTMGMMPWGLLGKSIRAMPDNFPRFVVPGEANEMGLLREMFFTFYRFFPYGTLWDPWMAKSLLWPAAESKMMNTKFGSLFGSRVMAEDGYVSSHQHRGMAHDLGWPFPLWTQVIGWGWHFSGSGNPYTDPAFGFGINRSLDGWEHKGVANITYTDAKGMHADLEPKASLATPTFNVSAMVAPFVRIEWWAEGLADAKPYLEWTTKGHPTFSPIRRMYFDAPENLKNQVVSMIPLQDVVDEDETLTRFRIGFGNKAPAKIAIQAIMTAVDSRHNINNAVWVMGCSDYIRQTGDISFIKQQIERMRKAMQYAMDEFQTKENRCVNTPWRGHDGRSGIVYEDGKKVIRHGFGIGNNYWDLLPFGGKDFQATIYVYEALKRMADLETAIAHHPDWGISAGFDPADLRAQANSIREFSQSFFWNKKTGRFVCAVDIDGIAHDYGVTFLNTDAVTSGLASPEQARQIMDWISGKRIVDGDTSTGDDIYRWRFGARTTTLRNTNYYSSVWPTPEKIAFGDQVQDGGAVLGFSYHDLMSRLQVYGPDNAWERLKEIINWYGEVEAEGGARAYYAKPGRGTLQGGGPAGGLGIDQEFMESALVPQVMLYGFMGFEPRLDGFELNPKLPTSWPSFKLTDIAFQDGVYDLFADHEKVSITMKSGAPRKLTLILNGCKSEIKIKPGTTQQLNRIKEEQ
jgi:hypothetical protein